MNITAINSFDGYNIVNLLFPLALIIFISALTLYALSFFYRKFHPKLSRTKVSWYIALLDSSLNPLKALVYLLAAVSSLKVILVFFQIEVFLGALKSIRNFFFLIISAVFIMRFIKNIEIEYLDDKRKNDKTTVRAICQISRIFSIAIAAIVFLQSQNVNLSAVLAFGGAGGLVVGLAAKDLLGNFFGGLMIFLDRPFSVGDWVSSPDREIEGYVEHIGWRLTKIRSFEKRPIYVPNGIFSNITVVNPSRMTNRRIKTRVGIRYEDAHKIKDIVHSIDQMITAHPSIDTTKLIMVRFDEFGKYSLNILIYCFTLTKNWKDYKLQQQDIFLKTIHLIEKHGAKCAFPTQTLELLPEKLTNE